MKYLDFTNYKDYETICEIWNKAYGLSYPISGDLLKRNLSNALLDKSYVVLNDEEKLVAFIIYKEYNDQEPIPGYDKLGWISLFFVDQKFRKQGIGSKLLELVVENAKKNKKEKLCLGRDCYNFFPGLPVDLISCAPWFEKRGFNRPNDTYDLIKEVSNKDKALLNIKNEKIEYRLATLDDKENLIEFLRKNWPGRWTKEALDYFENGGSGKEYVVGIADGKICAFSKIGYPTTDTSLISYSLTWRNRFKSLGGIGPLGVDISYRKQNIGHDIVVVANNILVENGASNIIIDWTGLVDFYRLMGYEVFKSYGYMTKEIK